MMVRQRPGPRARSPALRVRRVLVPAIGTQPGPRRAGGGLRRGASGSTRACCSRTSSRMPSVPRALSSAATLASRRARGGRARGRGGDGARARARRARGARDPHRRRRPPRRSSRWCASSTSTCSCSGANLRQFTGRPFLGHGVEYLLEEAPTTVVVVTVPPGWGAAREALERSSRPSFGRRPRAGTCLAHHHRPVEHEPVAHREQRRARGRPR